MPLMNPPHEIIKSFDRMANASQTKLIGPTIAFTVLKLFGETNERIFTAQQIRRRYARSVCELSVSVGTNLHLGATFDTAYISREDRGVGHYGILKPLGANRYELSELYARNALLLENWIPQRIKIFLNQKLGIILSLATAQNRLAVAENHTEFHTFLTNRLNSNDAGTSFEIVCFAILKVYLEKFSCRLYRDTRTFAHEGGTDLSTDFGAVFQIKKLNVTRRNQVDALDSELRKNFDADRIKDGRVVIIIDDITPDCRSYLLQKNSLRYFRKADLLEIASLLHDLEDRQKALRIIYEEFSREFANDICSRNNCNGIRCPILNQELVQ
jgi:hypothetical protein